MAVIKPQHPQTQLIHILVALLVSQLVLGFEMLTTIDFNHQICSGAIEIDDVLAYRFLSIKLPTIDLFAA
ncbi:hypothetical protein A1353_09115 [Methylomonas methanica]|uniref:Uncharacterized protein n=1 Tax=Methylomonas methanica TaxID=421 RepID=A0A177MLV1_METMH|nr:hypothetical protein A1353_09115 [Methylomonas methanica]